LHLQDLSQHILIKACLFILISFDNKLSWNIFLGNWCLVISDSCWFSNSNYKNTFHSTIHFFLIIRWSIVTHCIQFDHYPSRFQFCTFLITTSTWAVTVRQQANSANWKLKISSTRWDFNPRHFCLRKAWITPSCKYHLATRTLWLAEVQIS